MSQKKQIATKPNKFRRDIFLDLKIKPVSKAAKEFVELIVDLIAEVRTYENPKCRKQRGSAIENQRFIIGRIIGNIVHNEKNRIFQKIFVPVNHHIARENRDYFTDKFYTSQLKLVLNSMNQKKLDLLEISSDTYIGQKNKICECTTIQRTLELKKRINKYGITDSCFDIELIKDDNIILKTKKKNYLDTKKIIKYISTSLTRKLQSDITKINQFIGQSKVTYISDDERIELSLSEKRLNRYFCGDFASGGRLYGGLWQQIPKIDRHNIFINDNSTNVIDFSQMNPNLLYGKTGIKPPLKDSYILPGFEKYRDGVKLVFNSTLFKKFETKRFPSGCRAYFPKKIKVVDVISSIKESHPQISKYVDTEIGFELFKLESDLCLDILMDLMRKNIVALPIHDAFIVEEDNAKHAKFVMKSFFKSRYKFDIEVKYE